MCFNISQSLAGNTDTRTFKHVHLEGTILGEQYLLIIQIGQEKLAVYFSMSSSYSLVRLTYLGTLDVDISFKCIADDVDAISSFIFILFQSLAFKYSLLICLNN